MRILGHGVDIVEVARVERLLGDEHFITDWFTELEQGGAGGEGEKLSYFSGRISAKEAIAKALGTGFTHGIGWTDIEIPRSKTGIPQVVLYRRALEVSKTLGIEQWFLSISHSGLFAVASAIAVGK